jgi:hypothetical protein
MLPDARQIHESEIHDLDPGVADLLDDVRWCFCHFLFLLFSIRHPSSISSAFE